MTVTSCLAVANGISHLVPSKKQNFIRKRQVTVCRLTATNLGINDITWWSFWDASVYRDNRRLRLRMCSGSNGTFQRLELKLDLETVNVLQDCNLRRLWRSCAVFWFRCLVKKRRSCFRRVTLDVQKTSVMELQFDLQFAIITASWSIYFKFRGFATCRKSFHLQIFLTVYSILRVSLGFFVASENSNFLKSGDHRRSSIAS